MALNIAVPVLAELGFAILAATVFWAGCKRFGRWRTSVFFLGSILWTEPLENFAVLRGAYTYYGHANLVYPMLTAMTERHQSTYKTHLEKSHGLVEEITP